MLVRGRRMLLHLKVVLIQLHMSETVLAQQLCKCLLRGDNWFSIHSVDSSTHGRLSRTLLALLLNSMEQFIAFLYLFAALQTSKNFSVQTFCIQWIFPASICLPREEPLTSALQVTQDSWAANARRFGEAMCWGWLKFQGMWYILCDSLGISPISVVKTIAIGSHSPWCCGDFPVCMIFTIENVEDHTTSWRMWTHFWVEVWRMRHHFQVLYLVLGVKDFDWKIW